jgi:hypothetical protein
MIKENVYSYHLSRNDFWNSEGVIPLNFLKAVLNVVFELKPDSQKISNIVRLLSLFCVNSSDSYVFLQNSCNSLYI